MSLSSIALVDLTQAKNFLRVDVAASLRVHAEYVGVGNGLVRTFALQHSPIGGSLRLFVNGVLQAETVSYTISGVTVTFVNAPALNHHITVSYDRVADGGTFESFDDSLLETLIEAATRKAEDYAGRAFVQRVITESHYGNGSDVLRLRRQPVVSISSVSCRMITRAAGDGMSVNFSLGHTPRPGSLTVFVDGVLRSTGFTLSGQIVTFTTAPVSGAELIFRFEVSLLLGRGYSEQVGIGRLIGSWSRDHEYVIVYTAGYGVDRSLTQDAVPNAVLAVLLVIADLYENRGDRTDSIDVTGVGSTSYKMPSRAEELLRSLRTEIV